MRPAPLIGPVNTRFPFSNVKKVILPNLKAGIAFKLHVGIMWASNTPFLFFQFFIYFFAFAQNNT